MLFPSREIRLKPGKKTITTGLKVITDLGWFVFQRHFREFTNEKATTTARETIATGLGPIPKGL